jgi:integrase
MPKILLTQVFVDKKHQTEISCKTDYFDTKQSGLLLKILTSGRKSYYIRFTNSRGKQQEKKIGCASVLELTQARTQAKNLLAQIEMGDDPFAKKALLKNVPTFGDFVADSYLPHVKSYKRSWGTDECLLRNHILPLIGSLYLDQITRRHMVDLFSKHKETHKPGSTNRVIILCRYVFNCAIKWETAGLPRNPTQGIELFPENNKRERYLTAEEAQRLFKALDESAADRLKYIISMLLLTGARKNEVQQAQWKDFDLERRIWTIPFNKSGQTRYVPLSDGAVRLLDTIPPVPGSAYAFANPKTGKPYKHIFTAWDTARKKAGLSDFRIHDLRHSFASALINSGRSLYEVQKILGHTQVKTTQRYSHLSQESLVAAANTASSVVPLARLANTTTLGVTLDPETPRVAA